MWWKGKPIESCDHAYHINIEKGTDAIKIRSVILMLSSVATVLKYTKSSTFGTKVKRNKYKHMAETEYLRNLGKRATWMCSSD